MGSPIRPNEIRVVIRPVEARDYDLGPIPAELFKKTFDAFLTALQVTDRELQPKARSSEFLISQLALNPYEFGILEKRRPHGQNVPSAIEFFRRCAEGIYRSDYQTVVKHPRLTRAFIRIVKALDETGGNVTQAARLLKISRKSLQMKMKEFGLRDEEG